MSAAIALIGSLFVFLLLGWNEHRHLVEQIGNQLQNNSLIAARRLASEIALGPNGAVAPVKNNLEKELNIEEISISSGPPASCSKSTDVCTVSNGNRVEVHRKIPFIDENLYVSAASKAPSIWTSIDWRNITFSIVPFFLIFGIGLLLQEKYLQKHVILPIEALVDTTIEKGEVPQSWNKEFHEISAKLQRSIEDRDKALFGQLASGVVHDIKTLLHSLLTATGLVHEQPSNSLKRYERLEALFRACNINLSKMKDIIELTLDGSRDIPIRPHKTDAQLTIASAANNTRDLAIKKGIQIESVQPLSPALVSHDSVQLERALTNVVRNAVEAFDNSDNSRKRQIRISTDIFANRFTITVEDSGPGLKQKSSDLFKPFRSTKLHGTGLGLYVARKIVEGHQGSISADTSTTLHGAKIKISIPIEGSSGGTT